jgi:hypothetical protein
MTLLRHTVARAAIAGLVLATVIGARPGQAQTAPSAPPTRVSVTVTLVDRIPVPGAPFVVIRRAATSPHDVIVLPRGADATMFSEAVYALVASRQVAGDTSSRDMTLRVRPGQARAQHHPVLPWADRVLGDLRRADPRDVVGIGRVPAVTIWLPRQRPVQTNP